MQEIPDRKQHALTPRRDDKLENLNDTTCIINEKDSESWKLENNLPESKHAINSKLKKPRIRLFSPQPFRAGKPNGHKNYRQLAFSITSNYKPIKSKPPKTRNCFSPISERAKTNVRENRKHKEKIQNLKGKCLLPLCF